MSLLIQYLGHSAVRVRTEKGTEVLIDPWIESPVAPKGWQPKHVDAICLTHGHGDHVGQAIALAKKHRATVFAIFELAQLLQKDGCPESQLQMMGKGGTVELPGRDVKVSLTNAFHSSSYDASDGMTYYAGEPAGVVLTFDSGRTLYHAGDTCLFSDMRLIRERFKPFVAFLPIGDRFTMGPEEAAMAAEILGSEVLIPIHHSTFGALTGTPDQFKEAVSKRSGRVRVEALRPGDELTL